MCDIQRSSLSGSLPYWPAESLPLSSDSWSTAHFSPQSSHTALQCTALVFPPTRREITLMVALLLLTLPYVEQWLCWLFGRGLTVGTWYCWTLVLFSKDFNLNWTNTLHEIIIIIVQNLAILKLWVHLRFISGIKTQNIFMFLPRGEIIRPCNTVCHRQWKHSPLIHSPIQRYTCVLDML